MDPVESPPKKTLPLILIGASILFLILMIVVFIARSQKPAPTSNTTPATTPNTESGQAPVLSNGQPAPAAKTAPAVRFETYTLSATKPTVPSTSKIYTLKSDFTLPEVKTFAARMGLETLEVKDNRFVLAYNAISPTTYGMLTFDMKSGAFVYNSYGQLTSPAYQAGQSVIITANQFLTQVLGWNDPTITCQDTYRRQGLKDIQYVECHRDWLKAGLPILNFIGVLNTPETQPLAQLRPGVSGPGSPIDAAVYDTSSATNGRARPNDFNTITLAISTSTGRVVSIDSNIRWIDSSKEVAAADLISPEDALQEFSAHQGQTGLTIPAGEGTVDWNKVYQNNQANGKDAVITDYTLAYLEKPVLTGQTVLAPMYLIRGTSTLNTGYPVRFAEVVPATKAKLSFLGNIPQVAGETTSTTKTGSQGGQQQGSFSFTEPTSTTAPQPTTPPATTTTSPTTPTGTPAPTDNQCMNISTGQTLTVNVPGLGTLELVHNTPTAINVTGLQPHTFFFRSASFPITGIQQVRSIFDDLIAQQYAINVAKYAVSRSVSFPRTTNEALNLFGQIAADTNNDPNAIISGSVLNCSGSANIAPPVAGCALEDNHFPYDPARLQNVSNKTAAKLLQAGSFQAAASRANIFPSDVLAHFIYALSTTDPGGALGTGTGYVTQESRTLANACYVSGASPHLFLYTDSAQEFTIIPQFALAYSGQEMTNGSWKLSASSTKPAHLYYEYDRSAVSLTPDAAAFTVPLSDWKTGVRTLAAQYKLNDAETEGLVADMQNEMVGKSIAGVTLLRIAPVSYAEIQAKLPLTINQQVTLNRLQFVLSFTNAPSTNKPEATPVHRSGDTLVEVGARMQ